MDLAHLLDFDFKTSTLGTLRICALDNELHKAIREEVRDNKVDAKELTVRIFVNTAHKLTGDSSIDNICAGPAVVATEAASLTDEELVNFAEQYGARFFGKNDGRGPADGQPHGVDFLVFQIKESMRLDEERHARFLEQAKKLYSSATVDAMARNAEVSDRLSRVISDYKTPAQPPYQEIFIPPQNPIKETNEVLGQLLEKVERMQPVFAMCAELIQSMNLTALQMQSDSNAASARADKMSGKSMMVATIGIYISAAALVLSSGFSIWTIIDARKSSQQADQQTAALRKDIRDATTAANNARSDLERAAAEDRRALVAAVSNLVPADNHSPPKSKK